MLATANTDLGTANGRVTELEGMLATANTDLGTATTRADAFATAYHARTNAVAAAEKAGGSGDDRIGRFGKITVRAPGVAGDSEKARKNAQAVLTARVDANDAVTMAETALQSAKGALSGATDDSLIAALEETIGVAKKRLAEAKMSAESDALKDAVELVTGDNPEEEGYPMTPAEHGEMVAMAIGGALGPISTTDGAGLRVDHGAVPPDDAFEDAVTDNNHVGSTWAEIVGTTMKMRITKRADDTDPVDAASIADQPTSSVTDVADLTGMGLEDGAQHPGNYKGIPGTVFCAGTDCTVTEGVDGNTLTGSWYFTPTDGNEWYVKNAADTAYEAETLYARFGHWLSANETDDALTDVNTYAMTGGNTDGLDLTTVNAEGDVLTDTSAKYTGSAVGMSLHKEFDSQGDIVPDSLQSAKFTATVNLKATFGPSPTLGGTVNDFQGDATDSSWSVELLVRGFDGSFDETDAGTTVTSGQDGEWTAQAFGATGARPTGIFGGFNAHFTDGHAAGAYATRK